MNRRRPSHRAADAARAQMVQHDLLERGIVDPRVLSAMGRVRRERFVAAGDEPLAYADRALPIEQHQTISQPYVVALMAEALELRPSDRVLEIGTGSGYAAAVLAELAAEVVTVERLRPLAELAAQRLRAIGADNVAVHCADGTLGWPDGAPYDAIVAAAGGPEVPAALVDQLVPGGRLVLPVGPIGHQQLLRLRRAAGGPATVEDLGPVAFVPLIGEQGWPD